VVSLSSSFNVSDHHSLLSSRPWGDLSRCRTTPSPPHPSLRNFANSQDPAVSRFRFGYGGYHRSTGELFATEDVNAS